CKRPRCLAVRQSIMSAREFPTAHSARSETRDNPPVRPQRLQIECPFPWTRRLKLLQGTKVCPSADRDGQSARSVARAQQCPIRLERDFEPSDPGSTWWCQLHSGSSAFCFSGIHA